MQRYFNERVLEIFTRHGKRMIGWDEIFQEGLPTNVVIHSWRGREALAEAAGRGYAGILSNGYYIDLMQPTDFHYLNDPLPADSPLPRRRAGWSSAARPRCGRVRHPGDRGLPDLAADRGHRRAVLVARQRQRRRRHVPPARPISLLLEEHGLLHLKNRPMMLRRLCQCRELEPLDTLLGTIEPVKVYRRNALRKDTAHPYTQHSPLSRLVDIAGADAAPARDFRRTVERLLADRFTTAADVDAARSALLLWRDNHAAAVRRCAPPRARRDGAAVADPRRDGDDRARGPRARVGESDRAGRLARAPPERLAAAASRSVRPS